jgi:outer membrane protein, adhesin transport system
VKLSWQALLTARSRLELLENAVNIATEVFISRKKLREAGKETVINVLDAENEVSNAQINFTAASYEERLSIYQLLLAMGRLNPSHLNLAMKN